jgi:hypothetical protein
MNARARRCLRVAAFAIAEAILVGGSGLPARAQFPDVLSEGECPECAAQLAALPIEGTWSTPLTAADAAGWALADFACVTACTAEARARAAALFADPRNAERPIVELLPALAELNARDLRFGCDALGFAEQVASPLPLSIRREDGALVLRYEERGAVRTIDLVGHGPGSGDARLGTSTGRFEGDALVVETRGARVNATERYSVSTDGRWLELKLELKSSGKGAGPIVLTKRWLRTPNARIAAHSCDVMSAGLEASLADYLDPRKIDARR